MALPVVWEERCLAAETDCRPLCVSLLEERSCKTVDTALDIARRAVTASSAANAPPAIAHIGPICEHHVPIFCFACRKLGRFHQLCELLRSRSHFFHATSGQSAVELSGLRVICGLCTVEVRRESMASVRARFMSTASTWTQRTEGC